MLGVQEQVIGPIVEKKFENRKGVACRRLIIKRKMYGVSDGFRNSLDPQANQQDQALTDADRGKIEQNLRQSATRRNQTFNVDSGSGVTDENAQNVALFKVVIKSPDEALPQDTQQEGSSAKGENL